MSRTNGDRCHGDRCNVHPRCPTFGHAHFPKAQTVRQFFLGFFFGLAAEPAEEDVPVLPRRAPHRRRQRQGALPTGIGAPQARREPAGLAVTVASPPSLSQRPQHRQGHSGGALCRKEKLWSFDSMSFPCFPCYFSGLPRFQLQSDSL